QTLTLVVLPEVEVDARVPVVAFVLLVVLDGAGDLAADLDDEDDLAVPTVEVLRDVLDGDRLVPPSADRGLGSDRMQPLGVARAAGAHHHPRSLQRRHHPATVDPLIA